MNTAHRFWIYDAAAPGVLFLTASTREWAEIKVAAFSFTGLALVIEDTEA